MKKLYFKIDRKQSGVVGLIPENKEDIWHLYNLISIGDKIQAFTDRKVVSTAKTNPSTFRVRIRLKIQIESINVDLDACSLRLSGRNKTLSPHIQLEQYHTITLQLNQKFEIDKEHWDVLSKNRLKMALNNSANAELAVILMDNGSANLYLIAPNLTLHKATVNVAIPKKRNYSAKKHSAAITKFYDKILIAIKANVDFVVVKCLVVASPGFYKDDFKKWLKENLKKVSIKEIAENFDKFVFCHSSSSYKDGLESLLNSKEVQDSIKNTKFFEESKIFDDFLRILAKHPDKAVYGFKNVRKAVSRKAVRDLLVTDDFIRGSDVTMRKQIAAISNNTQKQGGKVHVLSSLSSPGEQLKGITGVAAILNFDVSDDTEEDY